MANQDSETKQPETGSDAPEGAPRRTLQRKQILRTWVLFVALIGIITSLFYLLRWFGIPIGARTSEFTALITAGLMKLFGDDSVRVLYGTHITSQIFSVRIIFECTGLFNVFILVAAVISFPSTWAAKAIGIFGGTLALLVANQARLLSLVYLGSYMSPEAFDTFHILVWQTLMIFITLGIWLFWASKFVTMAPSSAAAGEPAN